MSRARSALFKKAPLLLLLALAAARAALGWLSARSFIAPRFGDVGQWADVGDRLLRGQVPFRDFGTLYGPLLLGWVGVGYKLAGANWFAALFQLEVVSPVLCLLLAYAIAARALKEPAWRCLFLVAVAALGLDHFYWSPALRVWLPLSGLVLAARAAAEGRDLSLAGACLLCGACPWVSFETGCAAVLGAAILLVARLRTPGRRARTLAAPAAALLAPSVLMIAAFPRMSAAYGRTLSALAGLTNWYGGAPFPLPGPDLETYGFYAPLFCVAVAGALALRALLRGRDRAERVESVADLSLAAFAAACLRSLLGRSDYSHLIFCLPAVVLLWLRLCARRRRPALGAAALGLIPFVLLAARHGDPLPPRRPAGLELAAWPEEGLRSSRRFVERSRLIVAEIQKRVPPDQSLLSLPLPLYAHLSRRASALPANVPEQIAFGRGEPAAVVAALEALRVPLVVVDPALRLRLPDLDPLLAAASSDPLDGRLTWSTAADEAITRELREYLHSRYALERTIAGAAFYVRRSRPLPPRPEAALRRVAGPRALELGRGYKLPVPRVLGRELRFDVRCVYAPGLSSLAKTYALVGYEEESGVTRTAVLPVPPARLRRDLRLPLPPVRLKNVYIEVLSPGAFNPAPRAVELDSLRVLAR